MQILLNWSNQYSYDHSYNFIFNYYHPNQTACIQDAFVHALGLRSVRVSACAPQAYSWKQP